MTDDELDQRLRESILSDDVDASRIEHAVRDQIAPRPRHVRGWAVAAAAVIAMVLSAVFSHRTFIKEERIPQVCVAAAQDHQREIVKGDPRTWRTDVSAIQSLAVKQGVPASAIAALASTGYALRRGRLCFLNKQIFLHLVFSKDGEEFSVYLRPHGTEPSFTPSVNGAEVGSEDVAFFETTRVTAVFVSHRPGANAGAFARAAAKLL